MNSAPEIPDLKLANVGSRRKRRGGALPFFGGSGAGGGSFGAGAAGALAAKIGVSLLAMSLGAGAWSLGKAMRPDTSKFTRRPKALALAAEKQKYEGDLSNLPSNQAGRGDSLGMVLGSMDGLTPEERAAREAAAKAETDRKIKEAEEAGKQADAGKKGGEAAPPGADAIAAAVAGAAGADAGKDKDKGGALKSRFGSLSSSFGSGLAGGAGLSGGVGQSFSGPKLGAQPTAGSGRIGSFQQPAKPTLASARLAHVTTHGKGLAARQLQRAFGFSQASRSGAAETRTMNARAAFEDNAGEGSAITGQGLISGAGQAGTADATPTEGPIGGGPTTGSPATTSAPDVGTPVSVSPWAKWINIAKILLAIAGILLIIAAVLQHFGWLKSIAQVLGWAVAGLAAIVTLMGVMIMGMGQIIQGALFTALGGITAWAGYAVATAGDKVVTDANVKTAVAKEGFVSTVTSALATTPGMAAVGVGDVAAGALS